MSWKILCRVSGGVTGNRQAFLKADGVEQTFASQDEAATEAARLNREMNGPYSTARFSYTAVEALAVRGYNS